MSIIKFSMSRFPQVAEEILEFLLSSAELYDKRSVAGMMRSLKECFNIAYYHRIIPSLDNLISEERIDSTIRSRLSDLFDTSGSEQSSSPIYEEVTPPNTPPRSFEFFGEIGNDFPTDPKFDKLQQILEKSQVSKELVFCVLKCISHEFLGTVSVDLQRNSVYYQVFVNADHDDKIFEMLQQMVLMESAVGIRLLIFSMQKKSDLYFKLENCLERDLKSCCEEASIDALLSLYPFLLFKQKFTSEILLLFLSTATSELFFNTEMDLRCNFYKLLTFNLEDFLKLSLKIPTTQKLYL